MELTAFRGHLKIAQSRDDRRARGLHRGVGGKRLQFGVVILAGVLFFFVRKLIIDRKAVS